MRKSTILALTATFLGGISAAGGPGDDKPDPTQKILACMKKCGDERQKCCDACPKGEFSDAAIHCQELCLKTGQQCSDGCSANMPLPGQQQQ
jgi:hypothetical protein